MGKLKRSIESFGITAIRFIDGIGEFSLFVGRTGHQLVKRPIRWRLVLRQIEWIGIGSLPIIVLTSLFTGGVFAIQLLIALQMFSAENYVGNSTLQSLTKELGPVLSALMITGRCGSAMAAEIGTMTVTEQIDALRAMAVSPIDYLVVPRVIAGTIATVVSCALFDLIGFGGAWFVGVHLKKLDPGIFWSESMYWTDPKDLVQGIIKAACFGLVLSLIGCHRGYQTTGGAEGVGRSTTQAVVIASVAIFVLDFFLTLWFFQEP